MTLSGCGSGEKSCSPFIVSSFYHTQNDSAYAAFIDTAQYPTRVYIKCKFDTYLNAASELDTSLMAEVKAELDWLVPRYEKLTGVSDLGHLNDLYCRWDSEEAFRKRELDSELVAVCTTGENAWRNASSFKHYVGDLHRLEWGYQSLGDSSRMASVMSYLATGFEHREQIDSALLYLNRSRKICQDLDLREQLGDCDLVLASIHSTRRAEYSKAEQLLAEAHRCFQAIGHSHRIPLVDVQWAYNSNQLFQPDRAIRQAKRAMEGFRQSSNASNEGYCANLLAESYIESGNLDSAAIYADRAARVRKQVYENSSTDRALSDLAHTESTIGRIYRNQGKTMAAMEQYQKAHKDFQEAGDTSGLCLNLLRQAELFEQLEGYEEAEKTFRMANSISRSLYETRIHATYGLAVCRYRQGDSEGARHYLLDCISQLERTREELELQEMKAGLLADKIGFYDLLVTLYFERFEDCGERACLDTALYCLQRRKARTLEDALKPKEGVVSSQRTEKLSGSCLGAVDPATIQLQLLDEHEAMLEYQLSRFGSYVLVVTRDTVALININLSNDSLQLLLETFLDSVNAYPNSGRLTGSALIAAKKLFRHLIPELLVGLRSIDHLILVPSGVLYYLPVEALVTDDDRYLVETYDVSYVPSTATLELLRQRQQHSKPSDMVVAFGDPVYPVGSGFANLEHSAEEVAAIVGAFGPEKVNCFLGGQASEANLTHLDFSEVKYLHIAAHGFCDFSETENSAIVLSVPFDTGGSGYLTPEDIRQLELPLELAFLSACRTGTGRIFPGEGAMSLARPFIEAGCNSVIASYWSVDDAASAELVGHFYRYLKAGNSIGHSLTMAKRKLLESKRMLRPHPYFWAPYVLIGLDD